jgi:hypothetical protein
MNGSGVPIVPLLPPSPPRECVNVGGYEVCFYPGFVRRLVLVNPDGTETPGYEQKSPFVLPPGQVKPWPSSTIEVQGNGASIMVQVNDPDQQIDRMEISLKARDGSGKGARLVVEDVAVLCPPLCPE